MAKVQQRKRQRAQFQGSKKKARKYAFLEREKERRDKKQLLLPTIYKDPIKTSMVPVINAFIPQPMFFDYKIRDREKGPILLVDNF